MNAVPRLRFKHDDGSDLPNWEEKALGELIQSITNGTSATQTEFQTNYPVTRIETISDRTVNLNKVGFVQSAPSEKYLVRQGDILFSHINSVKHIGKTALYEGHEGNLFHGMNLLLIRPCSDVDYKFLFYMLNHSAFLRQVRRKTKEAVSQASINTEDIKSIRCAFPSQSEQQKIASFLSSVDKKIELLREMKNALVIYKKGSMQKIFSQKIRFKKDDGGDFPDWEEVYADEILKTVSNKNHDGTEKIVSISQTGGAVYRDQNGIDIIASEESVKNYKIIEPGDFVISLRSFQGGIEYSEIRGICSPAYTIMKPTVDLDTSFFRTFFKTGDFIKRLSLTVVGIRDGKQISFGAFSTVPLPFPSVPEQKKIASFLSKIDVKIQKTSSQIEQMETFKTGLLQQMFV